MAKLRRVAVIPSLFTLGNGICGFASVIVASRIHPNALLVGTGAEYETAMFYLGVAGWLIFAGMLFDVLDGRVARMSNTASRFGAELDSLCDVITFGVAPAFLLLKLGPTAEHAILYKVLFVSATLYVMCTILRLARFNVETTTDDQSHRFFKGLPSPAAAGCIASIAILRYDFYSKQSPLALRELAEFVSAALPFAVIGLALLMVSTVTYSHVVNQNLRGKQPFSHLIHLLLAMVVVVLIRELVLALVFWGFALQAPIRRGFRRMRRGAVSPLAEPKPTADAIADSAVGPTS